MNEQDPKQSPPVEPEAGRKVNQRAPEAPADPPAPAHRTASGPAPEAGAEPPPVDSGDDPAPPESANGKTPDTSQRGPLVTGVIIAVLVLLAGGEAWLFSAQGGTSTQATEVARLTDQVGSLQSKVSTIEDRLKATEDKVADLANRKPPEAAATKPSPAPAQPPAPSIPPELASKIAAMQASLASLSTTTLADHAAITTMQQQGADLPKLVARAQRLARVAQASLDLQNGQKLGDIPGAPAALARYATARPPTLPGLKASFDGYAEAAARAAGDTTGQGGFWQKVKGRIEGLVTVRHKDKVLIGSSAAGTLGDARAALDRDDLAAAVATLAKLPPAAASAMQPWTERAKHLLAARAALAKLAEQG